MISKNEIAAGAQPRRKKTSEMQKSSINQRFLSSKVFGHEGKKVVQADVTIVGVPLVVR